MTIDEMIAVLEAARAGKRIECRRRYQRPGVDEQWLPYNERGDKRGPAWDFSLFDYRPAPEPREWWLVVSRDDPRRILTTVPAFHDASAVAACWNGASVVHVREVLP